MQDIPHSFFFSVSLLSLRLSSQLLPRRQSEKLFFFRKSGEKGQARTRLASGTEAPQIIQHAVVLNSSCSGISAGWRRSNREMRNLRILCVKRLFFRNWSLKDLASRQYFSNNTYRW